jgi:hypothetical protein
VNGAKPARRRSVLVREAISAAAPEVAPVAASTPVGLAGDEHPPARTSSHTNARRTVRAVILDRVQGRGRAKEVEFSVIYRQKGRQRGPA